MRGILERFRKVDKYTQYFIILIIVSFIIRIALASIYHVSSDGCRHMIGIRYMAENLAIPTFQQIGIAVHGDIYWAPPIFHIICAFFYRIFMPLGVGAAEFAVKMVPAVFGTLTLWLTFLIGKKLFNRKVAFYSTLFLAFLPLHIFYSSIMFVDIPLTFFVMLSVYLMIEGKVVWSGVSAGLAILTKINAVFVMPLLLLIIFLNTKKKLHCRINKAVLFCIATGLAGCWWALRNLIVLGNPLWPYASGIFGGTPPYALWGGQHIAFNFINPKHFVTAYLGSYGVPLGKASNLFFFDMSFIKILVAGWLIATVFYSLPALIGFAGMSLKKRKNIIILAWIFLYFVLFNAIHLMSYPDLTIRFSLPAFAALAIVWGAGADRIMEWVSIKRKNKKIVVALLTAGIIVCCAGFVSAEFIKVKLASNEWGKYYNDFEWVSANLPEGGFLYVNSVCVPFNTRKPNALMKSNEDLANVKENDLIWVNQNFRIDPLVILEPQILKAVKQKSSVVYLNSETGTEIYRID